MIIEINKEGCGDLYNKIFHAIAGNNIKEQTFIDLCCAEATISRHFPFKEKTYVDALDIWNIPGHNIIVTDVLGNHPIFNQRFDWSFSSDGIEHLTKENGFRLIERMKTISDKQILFTPLGEYMVEKDNGDPKTHKSGWLPEDFPGFAAVVCPNYHKALNFGAFFVWRCDNIEEDFQRVKSILA